MSVRHKTVSVGTTATALAIVSDDPDGLITLLISNDSDVSVYIGGPGVTSSDYGLELPSGGSVDRVITPEEPLYAAVAADTEDVHLLSIEI